MTNTRKFRVRRTVLEEVIITVPKEFVEDIKNELDWEEAAFNRADKSANWEEYEMGSYDIVELTDD